jgi:hypothetical protein
MADLTLRLSETARRFAVLNTLNRTLPEAFRQTQIGNKHGVDDTRLENQRVAMEDVR